MAIESKALRQTIVLAAVVAWLAISQASYLEAQGVTRVWHEGDLPGGWRETSEGNRFSAILVSQEGLSVQSSDDREAVEFLRYLNEGGAQIGARPGDQEGFLVDYVNEKEYSEMLASQKMHLEYLQDRYGGQLPPGISQRSIGPHQALVFTVREDTDAGDSSSGQPTVKVYYRYFVGTHPGAAEGMRVDIGINHVGGVSPWSFTEYEAKVDDVLVNLRFSVPSGDTEAGSPVSPQDDGIPWAVVIGGIGVLAAGGVTVAAAAAGLAARSRKKRKPAEKDKDQRKEDDTVGYILQLSHDRLTLQAGEPTPLETAVWRVDSEGQYSIASDAQIALRPPGGIAVLPAHGMGRVTTQIELRDPNIGSEQILTVTEGSQTFHVFVPFVLRGEYSGVFYMKAKPSFGFVTNEILTSYNQTSIIFTALILFGFLGMFYIRSYTVSERDETQRLLFKEREDKLKRDIILKKEALFTKRIYHTYHKAEKVMGFIKEDLRQLSDANFQETKYRVTKYANFISRVIYDMKWYDPPVQTIRSQIFSTDLNEVVTFLVEKLFQRTSRISDHIDFDLDFDDNLPRIQVNEFVVWEILEPLIQNCIDHSGREKVQIRITTRYDQQQCRSTLTIEDDGVGIDETLLQRNDKGFQKLFDEHVSTKTDYQNNGYGCYIAYEMAKERCGWNIEAGNRENGGAVFTISIKHG